MESPLAALLWRSLRIYQVFGANTEVGKTVFTTLLCKSAKRHWQQENVSFLKPVSTGPLNEADDHHIKKFTTGIHHHTLLQYGIPVSPHTAALASGELIPSDASVLARCREHASERAKAGKGWLFMETAGGVHSPGPSGTTQADMYTPLRAPVVLVGDAKLGGISQTIASFEALRIRGYDVQSVMLFQDTTYQNYLYLADYFLQKYSIPVMSLQAPPERLQNEARDVEAMKEYYEQRTEENVVKTVLEHLDQSHTKRLARLDTMAAKAHETIWYPFTQHEHLPAKDIMTIDSAHGDYFQTYNAQSPEDGGALRASFDGSASWWTQGLGHANPQLTMAAAYAAGRYGHVMFAGAIHEPAMALAETLLQGTGNSRLARVFYSDNGSTGTEVAVKMGLRAARVRYGWGPHEKLGVLGLRGGYHGDTIGAMDCAEPCVYNENIEWYEGKGYWFDYPTILCKDGTWQVTAPPAWRRSSDGRAKALRAQGRKFGALIMEPIVLGAGGMAFVDPLFQRTLVQVIRRSPHLFTSEPGVRARTEASKQWSGLPILFDEVFTGLYRLGRFTPSTFLGVEPDVAVNAKLLTGGLVPLSTTMASEDVFDVFRSADKADALLHGHSYTAHPIGCQVGLESLAMMRKMEKRGAWDWAKRQGWVAAPPPTLASRKTAAADAEVWSVWPLDLVETLSRRTARVDGVWALGSVLAVHLRDEAGAGYSSTAALAVREALAKGEADGTNGPWNVHARVLGNVIYLMASQTTTREGVEKLSDLLVNSLQ
ncbi:dethiobiotin synthetase [Cordyceps militaris]|uniref:Dethiobiotin synthetase n=1 Tax=Cordyceps militaris TaxID=73501 RepID=A0A2H4SSH6_CORMI|nr:dethiobiotin synthetase [Cordyceps militaris]